MTVVVIGAGVIGSAIAEELASRGVRVTVLDMRSPGLGASQASAGLLAPYSEAREHEALLDLCTASLDLYDDFVSRVRERSGLAIEYARDGTLEVAVNEDEAARLRERHRALAERGVAADWVEPDRLREIEPAVTSSAQGALLVPAQGFVGAGSLVRALVQSARLNGATFESPAEALNIEPAGDGVEVRSDERRLLADAVVVAAGSWSGRVRIAGQPALEVRPIRGQLLQLAWNGGGLPLRPVWGSRAYTVPWAPSTLLVGATVEDVGFDERSTVAGVHDLLAAAGELLPGAWQSALAEVRVGLRPATADGLPLIGSLPSDRRIVLATGHYRNGVLLAPLTAKRVADEILRTS